MAIEMGRELIIMTDHYIAERNQSKNTTVTLSHIVHQDKPIILLWCARSGQQNEPAPVFFGRVHATEYAELIILYYQERENILSQARPLQPTTICPFQPTPTASYASLSGALQCHYQGSWMQSRISGWLQLVTKETKEEQKEQEKEAQNVSESVRLAIVTGERPRHKRRRSQSPSCDDSGEENEGSAVVRTCGTETCEGSGCKHSRPRTRRRTEMAQMVEFLEEACAEERKARDEKKARAEDVTRRGRHAMRFLRRHVTRMTSRRGQMRPFWISCGKRSSISFRLF
ncbi:hypothetical protein JB92DRAFT_3099623 [Gautieria morchelliformis]|nr:hypothetical protein JB92DRAFT_3099623 [Gautieria morchelliformis]